MRFTMVTFYQTLL